MNSAAQARRIAYHEAGHALVGHLMGMRVRAVHLYREGNRAGSGGRVAFRRSAVSRVGELLLVAAAGLAAEAQLYGLSVREYYLSSCQARFGAAQDLDDMADALNEARHRAGEASSDDASMEQRVLERSVDFAQKLCDCHWPVIHTIAKALLQHRRLPGSFVHRACTAAGLRNN